MEIKFRYTYRRKEDGHVWQVIYSMQSIENGTEQFGSMLNNNLWEIIARDLYTGQKDKDGNEIYGEDKVKWHDKHAEATPKGGFIAKDKFSKIVWRGCGFWVEDEDFGYEGENLWRWEEMEVIGNTHEQSWTDYEKEKTN